MKEELDQSKPYVPLLERSSQLMEESILSEAIKLEIDATSLPLRKKARKLRAKAEKAAKKGSINIEEVDKENEQQEVGECICVIIMDELLLLCYIDNTMPHQK